MQNYGGVAARRRVLKAIAVVAGGAMLASCATFLGPRQVEIPLYKLQAGLDRRFPVNNRAMELFDVHLTRPQVALLPQDNRIGLSMQAEISPFFLKRAYSGAVAFSGQLYVDPYRGGVFMADPHVDRFDIDGVDPNTSRQLTKVANILMDKVVRDTPVYSFRMEDLRYAGVQFVPTRIDTTSNALVVTLEPMK